MSVFVLVHGAWHGAWCWEKVVPELEKAGHKVLALDLPGHGKNTAPIEEQTLETYADYVCKEIEKENTPVILVGHSLGGFTITKVGDMIPDKIAALVYLCAFLPRNGQSANGLQDGIQPTDFEEWNRIGLATISESGKSTVLSDEALIGGLCNGLSEDDVQRILSSAQSEPLAIQKRAIRLTGAVDNVKKAYICCEDDHILLPEFQDKMLAATKVDRLYTMQTGHSAYYGDPEQLAKILLECVEMEENR